MLLTKFVKFRHFNYSIRAKMTKTNIYDFKNGKRQSTKEKDISQKDFNRVLDEDIHRITFGKENNSEEQFVLFEEYKHLTLFGRNLNLININQIKIFVVKSIKNPNLQFILNMKINGNNPRILKQKVFLAQAGYKSQVIDQDMIISFIGKQKTWLNDLQVKVQFSISGFPFRLAAGMKFITPIYHPNISQSIEYCFCFLQNKWAPTHKILSLVQKIVQILENPRTAQNLGRFNCIRNNHQAYDEHIQGQWREKARLETLKLRNQAKEGNQIALK